MTGVRGAAAAGRRLDITRITAATAVWLVRFIAASS
jgi:hypothetical protein